MTGVLWAHPEWSTALALTVLVAGAALTTAQLAARRHWRRWHVPAGGAARPPLAATLRDALLGLALAAVAVALAGPVVGERVVRVPARGPDLVLLVDASRSMDAQDAAPGRIERARRAASALLERLPAGSRVALAAFAGRGVLLTPLTPDRVALGELVPALDSQLLRPGGSDLAAGIEAGLAAFDPDSLRPRALVVLSDGEVERRGLGDARDALRRANVSLHAAVFGSPDGATIPDQGAPLRDATGAIVITRSETELVARLAHATGGTLHIADRWGGLDLGALVRSLDPAAGAAGGALVERRLAVPVVAPFALVAFGLLVLESLLASRRSSVAGRARDRVAPIALASGARNRLAPIALAGGARNRLAPIALAALAVLGVSGPQPSAPPAQAAVVPPRDTPETVAAAVDVAALETRAAARRLSPREWLELGLAREALGKRDGALRALRAAALQTASPRVAARAFHDLGVLALDDRAFETARDHFFDALALDPELDESRANLEWTLAALHARAQPGPAEHEAAADPHRGKRLPGPDSPPTGASSPEPEEDSSREPGPESPRRAAQEPGPARPPPSQAAQAPTPSPVGEAAGRGSGAGDGASDLRAALGEDARARLWRRVRDDPRRALATASGRPGPRRGPERGW